MSRSPFQSFTYDDLRAVIGKVYTERTGRSQDAQVVDEITVAVMQHVTRTSRDFMEKAWLETEQGKKWVAFIDEAFGPE